MRLISARVAVASVLLSAALSACVVVPASGYYADVAVTDVAPPAPQYEVVGVAPSPGYIWIGGAWFWEGGAIRLASRPLGSPATGLPLGASHLAPGGWPLAHAGRSLGARGTRGAGAPLEIVCRER